MKVLAVLLVAIIFVFSFFASNVLAGGDPVDSVRVAQVFGGVQIDSFVGQFNFNRSNPKNSNDWVNGRFEMTNGKITYLVINDAVILGKEDEPLEGLPVNAVGETRNFYLYLSTQDWKAYGDFQKDLLLPGEPIEVVLKPNYVPVVIPFAGKGSTKPESTVLKTESGNTSWYDSEISGFKVWTDPLKATAYTIVDTVSGLVVSSGVIDPLRGAKTDANSVVNIKIEGGVVILPTDSTYTVNQKFDGQLTDGTPAKVYIWSLDGKTGDINAWSDTGNVHISVLRWSSAGELLEISSSDDQPSGYLSSSHSYAFVRTGYDKVIIVVTGSGANDFDISFATSNGGGGGGAGGGGKG